MEQLKQMFKEAVHFMVRVTIGIRPAIMMGMILFSLITAIMGCHNQPIDSHTIDGFLDQSSQIAERL